MGWFRSRNQLNHKTVLKWIWSINSTNDVDALRTLRKQVQNGMFNEIVEHVVPVSSDADGETAYLLVHLFSGRSRLPAFKLMLDVKPEITTRATELFAQISTRTAPSEQFELTAVYNCCIELVNETIEQHYQEALMIADHGLAHWPQHAELWRQRGVLKLTQHDYDGAISDLRKARSLKAAMFWLDEPLKFAEEQVAQR